MGVSVREAAELVGMSKPGILKAIRQGRISAEKDISGEWRIEPVELFRVYKPVSASTQILADTSKRENAPLDTSLQVENEQLRQRLADKDDVIADLRSRLDSEAEERRKLTLILTEVRGMQESTQPVDAPRKAWWAWLFGG